MRRNVSFLSVPALVMFMAKDASAARNVPDLTVGFAGIAEPGSLTRFVKRGPGYSLTLAPHEAVIRTTSTIKLRWLNANPRPESRGEGAMSGSISYFLGNDPKRWRTDIRHYREVRYRNIYPGIDLVFHTRSGLLEHDWIVAPDSDPSSILLEFSGDVDVRLDSNGDLLLAKSGVDLRLRRPDIFQSGGKIAGRYVLHSGNRVGFQVGPYDRRLPLIIDPVLIYSTLLGGSGDDGAFGLAVDKSGNVYVAGLTPSADFLPATSGMPPHQKTFFANSAFVAKFNSSATALLYMAYFGGSDDDMALAIAVDDAGNAHVTGGTHSSDFPTTPGAPQSVYGGNGGSSLPPLFHPAGDAFVAKLNPQGNSLVYSTFLGGAGKDQGYGIAVDGAGNAYVAGITGADFIPGTPDRFPVTAGAFQASRRGSDDGFVAKLNGAGTAFSYCTLLGGSGGDYIFGLGIDTSGNTFVAGFTESRDFPITSGAFQTTLTGTPMAFAAKLNAAGGLVYGTYIGGALYNGAYGIAVDTGGSAYITGVTNSEDFPVTAGAYRTKAQVGPRGEVFVTKLNPAGSAAVYSSLIGGNSADYGTAIAVDRNGIAYVTGRTFSSGFPTTPNALRRCGASDAYLVKLDATATSLMYSSHVGGSLMSAATAVTLAPNGSVWVAGSTNSRDFPVTAGAIQPTFKGQGLSPFDSESLMPYGGDAFLMNIDPSGAAASIAGCVFNSASFTGGPISPGELVSIFGGGMGPDTGAAGVVSNGSLETTIADTRVLFDGIAAPLLYVRSDQINAVAPFEIRSGSTEVQVEYKGVRLNPVSVLVVPAMPGIFTLDASGLGQGAILNQDGSVNSPANPARCGSVVSVFVTGLGMTEPAAENGKLNSEPLHKPVLSVGAFVGGVEAQILYAGAAPSLVAGTFQVNILIPAQTPPSDATALVVIVRDTRGVVVGGSQNGVTFAVR